MAQYKHDRFLKQQIQNQNPFNWVLADVDAWYEAEIAKAEHKAEQKAKRENQQEIALKMLQKNMPLETIAELTELNIEQIQQLRSN